MILTYRECIAYYGTDYKIKKEIQAGRLFKKDNGIYSDEKFCLEIALIVAKYPRAIFTCQSAHYYHGLTDIVPNSFHLATLRTDSRIKDTTVKQYFVNSDLFEHGKTYINYHGVQLSIYNKERLLVDLVRQKNNFSHDYYKTIINNYRQIVEKIDFCLVEEYAGKLRNRDSILKAIDLEVL